MYRHKQIQGLINSLSEKEKSVFLQREDALSEVSKHADLLSNYPHLPKKEIVKKLNLSDKKYKTLCETTYNRLCRFLLLHKDLLANDIEYNLREKQLLAELMKEKGLIPEAQKK